VAEEFRPNACAKCQGTEVRRMFDPAKDALTLTCVACGHSWDVTPADRPDAPVVPAPEPEPETPPE
jgi:hypothetical protein